MKKRPTNQNNTLSKKDLIKIIMKIDAEKAQIETQIKNTNIYNEDMNSNLMWKHGEFK